jgi:hypothetical protein
VSKIEFRLGRGAVAFVAECDADAALACSCNAGQLDIELIVFPFISDSRSGRGGVGMPSPKLTEKNALVLLALLSTSVLPDEGDFAVLSKTLLLPGWSSLSGIGDGSGSGLSGLDPDDSSHPNPAREAPRG